MRRVWFPPLLFILPLLWMFRRALFDGEMFAFRDSSHYYFPLYKYVQQRWQNGVPLWNPFDNLGQPLLGDPTAAVLYPGKLIFTLPLDYSTCFALYVVLHLWLAGYGAYMSARALRATHQGALVCGLSYELSGHVLFQYCNPIFCVGAAWLPWAFVCLERMVGGCGLRERWRWAVTLSVVLCLMVFGGDPQIAYHFLLVAALRVCFFRSSLRCSMSKALSLLAVACVLALTLSAVQVLPSYEWARQSDRSVADTPRTIWEWAAQSKQQEQPVKPEQQVQQGEYSGLASLWQKSEEPGHAARVYDFSVGPWRWTELFWPNVTGPLFPVYGRWVSLLPGEGRTWTPSLYLGLLSILLALVRFRFLPKRTSVRASRLSWLSWLTVLSMLAAVGKYGFGWLLNELQFQVSGAEYEPSSLLPGCGGLYWLLTVALPGYASFRYPAKWWTVASLGIALLAAKGWPGLWAKQFPLKRFGFVVLATLVPTLVAAFFLIREDAGDNSIFGPFRPVVAWRSVGEAALVAVVLLAIMAWFVRCRLRRQGIVLVLLLVLDLLLAQRHLVPTRPASEWITPQRFADTTLYRSRPRTSYPDEWSRTSSNDRFAELKRNDAATLMPKHHLLRGTRSLRSAVAMTSSDYAMLWELCGEVGSKGIPLQILSNLGAQHLFAPADAFDLVHEPFQVPTNLVHYPNKQALPRAWAVANWRSISRGTDETLNRKLMTERTRDVWFDEEKARDLRDLAFVESKSELPKPPGESSVVSPSRCELLADEPERIVIKVSAARPSVVVVRDQFAPGWHASRIVEQQRIPTEVLRVNRVMRGVFCEAGEHVIELTYRPNSVFVGALISGTGWFILSTVWLAAILVRVRSGS